MTAAGAAGPPALVDRDGRTVSYLRVSLTDRCNYRCTYCMPEAGAALVDRAEILSFEEIARVVRVFAAAGVTRVRLTGGEPTVRRGLVDCVRTLASVPGIRQVVMTTNGHRLAELAAPLRDAGLAAVNVSLDTLDAARFARITRGADLAAVVAGIDAARRAGLPVKTNTVCLDGFNDDELWPIAVHAWARGALPRFIEWMPMSAGELWAPGALLEAAAIRSRLEAGAGRAAVAEAAPAGQGFGPARYHDLGEGRRFGVISALSQGFCDSCNRVRLSAAGALQTCLARDDATDLRSILRGGGSDDDLRVAALAALGTKRSRHDLTREGCGGPAKHMVTIGG